MTGLRTGCDHWHGFTGRCRQPRSYRDCLL